MHELKSTVEQGSEAMPRTTRFELGRVIGIDGVLFAVRKVTKKDLVLRRLNEAQLAAIKKAAAKRKKIDEDEAAVTSVSDG